MLIRGHLLLDPNLPPTPGWLSIVADRIHEVGEGEPPEPADLGDDDCLISPGFIDAHLHFPQIDAIGCDGLDLLDWLEHVIFPAEMKWSDAAVAAQQTRDAYGRMHRAGTLGYAAFLTSHFHGYECAVRAGHTLPLRGYVGQVMMDRHGPPPLLNHPLTRIARSERSRATASVNPRFAVACSSDLLHAARAKARDDSIIHTHLAESKREVELVRELFPEHDHYTGVYDQHGLLTPRTLLAHAIHLSKPEWELIGQRGSVVVHCPTANTFLQSGLFDMRAAVEHGVRIGVGSDIAAGSDFSMPRVARAMIDTAKMRRMTLDPRAIVPTPALAWQMITLGNARCLGWEDSGTIETGALADLLIIRPPDSLEWDAHFIGRLLYGWSEAWIETRIVNGKVETSARRKDESNE